MLRPTGPPSQGTIVGIAPTHDGGYWTVASDGAVFTYGDAIYYGSAEHNLTSPIVAIASTPDDQGYWLVAWDGQVFAFGDARVDSSANGSQVGRPGESDHGHGRHSRRQGLLAGLEHRCRLRLRRCRPSSDPSRASR